jgi:hypothetical protein
VDEYFQAKDKTPALANAEKTQQLLEN